MNSVVRLIGFGRWRRIFLDRIKILIIMISMGELDTDGAPPGGDGSATEAAAGGPSKTRILEADMMRRGMEAFGFEGMADLEEAGVSVKTALKYSQVQGMGRFSARNIAVLARARVKPEVALQYPESLDGADIVTLVRAKIGAATAVSYLKAIGEYTLFSVEDVVAMVRARITVQEIADYSAGRLEDVLWLHELKLSGVSVKELLQRFDVKGLRRIVEEHVSFETAMSFPRGYHAEDVILFVKREVSSDEVAKYPVMQAASLLLLMRRGFSGESVSTYPERFDAKSVLFLADAGIDGKKAATFPLRFNADAIVVLDRAGLSGERVTEYSPQFGAGDIVTLTANNVLTSVAAAYPATCSGSLIVEFQKQGVTSQDALEFCACGFSLGDILTLRGAQVTPQQATLYWQKVGSRHGFGVPGIVQLAHAKIASDLAESYDARFSAMEIVGLCSAAITPKEALGYGRTFLGSDIVRLKAVGISGITAKQYSRLGVSVDDIIGCEKGDFGPDGVKKYFREKTAGRLT